MSDAGQISSRDSLPSDFLNLSFEKFDGLNTKPPRPAIAAGEMFWSDGWMPIGPSNLRILWGTGPDVYVAPTGKSVVWFDFGNIDDTPYMAVLLSDGSMQWVNTTTNISGQIMAGGTIQNPSTIIGFSQWGSQYLIFAKDQDNAYWLWDGNNLFGAGQLGPELPVVNAGTKYTDATTVGFQVQTTGSGTGVQLSAQVENGSLVKVVVNNPGSGFAKDDFTAISVGGGGSDNQAIALPLSPTLTSGGLSEVIINSGGSRYTARANAVITGDGTGAEVSLAIQNGTIVDIAVTKPGQGYTTAPTIAVTDPGIPGTPAIPGGTGFSGFCNIALGQILTVPISDNGSGYIEPPKIVFLGDGVGATAIATIDGGTVSSVIMKDFGHGYTKAVALFEGGNNAANVRAAQMPFGLSGTAVEVYQQRVWLTNGAAAASFPPKNRTIFSGPESPVDFGNGGGAFQSTDSFLRVGYHWLKQTNGFLYLGGDSSVNYISGVQATNPSTTGVAAVPITTFGNQNVDPQLGSPWPSSVQVFSRNIVFANSLGVFVSYGGAVTKVSESLDGFYTSGAIFAPALNFSSAVASIFGIPVYMLLLPVIDRFTAQPVNKLLMWTGKKWFTSQQDRALTYIAEQEINSVLTAWGTDGTKIFRLFQQPSTGFAKTVQSKLFSEPAYFYTKTAIRLSGVVETYALDQPLTISLDNEGGVGIGNAVQSVSPGAAPLQWTNNSGAAIDWTNNAGNPIAWGNPGLDVFGPYPIGQQGRMLGFTVTTTASDLALLSLSTAAQDFTLNL